MKELTIEWRHYDKGGETCERCSNTGNSLSVTIEKITEELKLKAISVVFTETMLPAEDMAQSNLILLNGVPLEVVLEGAKSAENECPSCSCLTGKETSCRTVEHEGVTYEDIPADLIRKAIFKAAGIASSHPS